MTMVGDPFGGVSANFNMGGPCGGGASMGVEMNMGGCEGSPYGADRCPQMSGMVEAACFGGDMGMQAEMGVEIEAPTGCQFGSSGNSCPSANTGTNAGNYVSAGALQQDQILSSCGSNLMNYLMSEAGASGAGGAGISMGTMGGDSLMMGAGAGYMGMGMAGMGMGMGTGMGMGISASGGGVNGGIGLSGLGIPGGLGIGFSASGAGGGAGVNAFGGLLHAGFSASGGGGLGGGLGIGGMSLGGSTSLQAIGSGISSAASTVGSGISSAFSELGSIF